MEREKQEERIEPWWSCPYCKGKKFEINKRVVQIEYGFTDGYTCKQCGYRGIIPYKNM